MLVAVLTGIARTIDLEGGLPNAHVRTNYFGDCLLIAIVRTNDFGVKSIVFIGIFLTSHPGDTILGVVRTIDVIDYLVIGIVYAIVFGCCLLMGIVCTVGPGGCL